MRNFVATLVVALATACAPPSPQPQPNEVETVNGTLTDDAAPAGALNYEDANYAEGPVTPAEQGNIHATEPRNPKQVVALFADLLHQKRFGDAYRLVDPQALGATQEQFEARFNNYDSIDAAVGKIGPTEGAAGSLYDNVQLTLSGKTKAGGNYVLTGPVTLRRVNDVPGATEEQRKWRIVKIVLTSIPEAADALVSQ